MRWLATPLLALLVVLGLFLLMQWMIAPPDEPPVADRTVDGIEIVRVEPEDEEKPPEPPQQLPSAPPPPPPPAAFSAPSAVALPVPALAAPVGVGPVKVPVAIGGGSPTLGGSGAFGGFARGIGSGAGGDGFGRGEGFKGKDLVPLSTARPQISQWAHERGIEGWVEVVFTVMPNGRVQDVKIVDAQPRGVFEAAAIESISNWIYAEHPRARMVKQRVEFKLEDFQYNWR
ncbi:MAG: TonB family protein [Gammaproteobacteria bacterium]|nr:TonB family protein [Gammaproteobacteria bacterium]